MSLQQEARNATDPIIPPLNCSEITNDVGNPAVTKITWSVTSEPDSLCVGIPTGSLNELYTFNPSHNLRNCNNANVVCRAANEVGSTTKTFTLIFNCESKRIQCCDIDGANVLAVPGIPTNPLQGSPIPNGVAIAWQAPIDDGGFDIINYKYDVIGKISETVPSATTSANISGLGVAELYTFTVSAGNALGRSDRLNVSFESPDSKLVRSLRWLI